MNQNFIDLIANRHYYYERHADIKISEQASFHKLHAIFNWPAYKLTYSVKQMNGSIENISIIFHIEPGWEDKIFAEAWQKEKLEV